MLQKDIHYSWHTGKVCVKKSYGQIQKGQGHNRTFFTEKWMSIRRSWQSYMSLTLKYVHTYESKAFSSHFLSAALLLCLSTLLGVEKRSYNALHSFKYLSKQVKEWLTPKNTHILNWIPLPFDFKFGFTPLKIVTLNFFAVF